MRDTLPQATSGFLDTKGEWWAVPTLRSQLCMGKISVRHLLLLVAVGRLLMVGLAFLPVLHDSCPPHNVWRASAEVVMVRCQSPPDARL